jgi:lipoprotein-anchoring transpeptidase ErfK/SrfK
MVEAATRFRLVSVAAWALLTAGAVIATAGAAPTAKLVLVRRTQQLAVLLSAHEAFSAPNRRAVPVALVGARRPLTGEETVLPVLAHRTGANGSRWLYVRLPGRPNGLKGWISRRRTTVTQTPWHIVVSTSERKVIAYRLGRVVQVFKAVVGKPATPTPLGDFFVEETLTIPADGPGAPFALALSARSTVYSEFDGGPGQIAVHGVSGIGGVPGTAVSHGCVRLEAWAMRWLGEHIGPGVPVTITG